MESEQLGVDGFRNAGIVFGNVSHYATYTAPQPDGPQVIGRTQTVPDSIDGFKEALGNLFQKGAPVRIMDPHRNVDRSL